MVGTAGIVAVGDGSGVGVVVAVGIGVFAGISVAVVVGIAVGTGVTAPHPTKLTETKTTKIAIITLFAGFNDILKSILSPTIAKINRAGY